MFGFDATEADQLLCIDSKHFGRCKRHIVVIINMYFIQVEVDVIAVVVVSRARTAAAAALSRSLDRARRRHARVRRLGDAKSRVIARIIARACVAHVRHSSARHPEPPLPSRRPPVIPHARARRLRRWRWRRHTRVCRLDDATARAIAPHSTRL